MEKYVEYFQINYDNFPMYKGSQCEQERHETFIELLRESLDTKEYILKQSEAEEEPSIIIEIIEIENNYMFGLIGKLNDLSNKTLLRVRGKGIDEIHEPIRPEELNYYLENFTYFCVRTNDLVSVVLKNSSAPSFKKHFSNLMKKEIDYKGNYFDDIYTLDVIDENIRGKLDRFKDILNLNIGYKSHESDNNGNGILHMDDEFGISQSQVEYMNVDLSLKPGVNQEKMKKKLSQYKEYDRFSNFKINAIDEEDAVKGIDLIRNIITRKVHINIDEKYLMSTDGEQEIKKELKSALSFI